MKSVVIFLYPNPNFENFQAVTQAKLNLSEKKDLNIMEDAEGDVDMVLEEEGAKIEEKERIAKEELEKELRQYRIKVNRKIFTGKIFNRYTVCLILANSKMEIF